MKNMPQSMIIEREATAREKFSLIKSIIISSEGQGKAAFESLIPDDLDRLRFEDGPLFDRLMELARVAQHENGYIAKRRERWIRDHKLTVINRLIKGEKDEEDRIEVVVVDRKNEPVELPEYLFAKPNAITAEISRIVSAMAARRTEAMVDTLFEGGLATTPLQPGSTANFEEEAGR